MQKNQDGWVSYDYRGLDNHWYKIDEEALPEIKNLIEWLTKGKKEKQYSVFRRKELRELPWIYVLYFTKALEQMNRMGILSMRRIDDPFTEIEYKFLEEPLKDLYKKLPINSNEMDQNSTTQNL